MNCKVISLAGVQIVQKSSRVTRPLSPAYAHTSNIPFNSGFKTNLNNIEKLSDVKGNLYKAALSAKNVLSDPAAKTWLSIFATGTTLAASAITFSAQTLFDVVQSGSIAQMAVATTMLLHTLFISIPYISYNLVHSINTIMSPKAEAPPSLPDNELPDITVIIPMRDEPIDLVKETSIKSVINADYPKEKLHVVVIDNSSKKENYQPYEKLVGEIAQYNDLDITFHHREGTEGKKARNLNIALGLKEIDGKKLSVKSDIFVTMDADIEFESDALRKVAPEFVNNEKLPFASLNVVDAADDNSFNRSMGYFNSTNWGIISSVERHGMSTFWGQCTVFRREALEDIGGFSETNVAEDTSAGFRIRALEKWDKGLRVNYTKAIDRAPENLTRYKIQQNRWATANFETNFNEIRKGILKAKHVSLFEKMDILYRQSQYALHAYNTLIEPVIFGLASLSIDTDEEIKQLMPMAYMCASAAISEMSVRTLQFIAAKSKGFVTKSSEILKMIPATLLYHGIGFAALNGVIRGSMNKNLNFVVTPKGSKGVYGNFFDNVRNNKWELLAGGMFLGIGLSSMSLPAMFMIPSGLGLTLSVFAHRFNRNKSMVLR